MNRKPEPLVKTNYFAAVAFVLTGALGAATPAFAANVYLESFDSGTPLASDPLVDYSQIGAYWHLGSGFLNGYVIPCTAGPGCSSSYTSGNQVWQDASGTGDFLFENTGAGDNNTGNNTFFASSSFSVSQDTDYTISFALINATTCCFGQVVPYMNGVALGGAAVANGPYTNSYNAWQTFTYTWNSGSNSTAVLTLQDPNSGGEGNDFGVDNVCVSTENCATSASPEPVSMLLFGTGLSAVAVAVRRRRGVRTA